MKKVRIFYILIACLLFGITTTFAQNTKNEVTNTDVLKLAKAGLPESTIISTISQFEPNFDTSVKTLINLRERNVANKVLVAMLRMEFYKNFLNSDNKTVKEKLTNKEILELTKADIGEEVIVLSISQSNHNFDTSTNSIIELTKEGVNSKVLEAMIRSKQYASLVK